MSASAVPTRGWRQGLRFAQPASAELVALVGFAGLLSVAVVVLVLGQHGASTAAALAATTMTAPVAYARRAPTAAGISLAVAAVANEVFFGHLIRCAAALPAVFLVAFVASYALSRRAAVAVGATVMSLVLQCLFDPRLGVGALAIMLPLDFIFAGAGLYVRTLATMVTALRNSATALLEQREQTVRLAVAAEREELTARLDHTLRQHIEAIADVARSRDQGDVARSRDQGYVARSRDQGYVARSNEPERFAVIERLGRQTLDQMRELLGSLRDSPTEPEPGLADLADICSRATSAHVQLSLDGTPRALPVSIELAACRIVEQLLRILRDEPAFRIRLHVDVAHEGIDIVLVGTASAGDVDLEHVRALAQARAVMHGGTVAIADRSGERRARVWLPLLTSHGVTSHGVISHGVTSHG